MIFLRCTVPVFLCFFTSTSFSQQVFEAQKKKKPQPLTTKYAVVPTAVLTPTTQSTSFPADADSNSPFVWVDEQLIAFNSAAGQPWRSIGPSLFELGEAERIVYQQGSNGGRWMEAVIKDERGILYGFYHNEPLIYPPDQVVHFGVCGLRADKTIPRIGMARSKNNGQDWDDLGIVLEANKTLFEMDCLSSENHYFVGGHGDFSAILKEDSDEVFIYFSNYSGLAPRLGESFDQNQNYDQGIAVAWMPWSKRDQPVGQFHKYYSNTWDTEKGLGGYASAINPEFANKISWHEITTDAFWGPSIHYNTYLKMYVMLLNHAVDTGPSWKQEGIYISFSPSIENPAAWSRPVRIIEGGGWYPQVVGIEIGEGTDKLASQKAYFFVSGKYLGDLTFYKTGDVLP